MKEDFVHYLWKFQKFEKQNLQTTCGELLKISRVGTHNHNQGPDFLMAQLLIGDQKWAGNIEIHVKSSHWFCHGHQDDKNYENVILHVVWEHDQEIQRKDHTFIPTLELKDRVAIQLTEKYFEIYTGSKRILPCENYFSSIDEFTFQHWIDRLFFERLESKTIMIYNELEETKNDWEAVFFRVLFRNFGLKLNGPSFFSISKSIPYSLFKKSTSSSFQLESLLFGQAEMLEPELMDSYFLQLKENYEYLKSLYGLDTTGIVAPNFFRLRPSNFPTIRMAQFAYLWSNNPTLFSAVISAQHKEEFYALFASATSPYWKNHYNFGKDSHVQEKKLSKAFIDLLLINTVIPIKFAFAAYRGEEVLSSLENLAYSIVEENNKMIVQFKKLREMNLTAFHSQALSQLYHKYCLKKKCLHCAIGNSVLNG